MALAILVAGSDANAAGTAAGTVISNTATAYYTLSGTSQKSLSNTNIVKVDEILNVTVTTLTSSAVPAGSDPATLQYLVTNNGNGSEPFLLNINSAVTGNAFNSVPQVMAIDVNGNGVYDPGVDSIIANGASSPILSPDASVKVLVLVNVPITATNGQTSKTQLTAVAAIGSGAPGTLLVGKGNAGVDAVVGATGAQGSALAAVVTSVAAVTLTKSAAIVDPYGGNTPMQGAIVTYSLVAEATGAGQASAVVVSDPFPVGTSYQAGSMTLDGIALTDAADSDAGAVTTTGISVALGNMVAGSAHHSITFKVKIN